MAKKKVKINAWYLEASYTTAKSLEAKNKEECISVKKTICNYEQRKKLLMRIRDLEIANLDNAISGLRELLKCKSFFYTRTAKSKWPPKKEKVKK